MNRILKIPLLLKEGFSTFQFTSFYQQISGNEDVRFCREVNVTVLVNKMGQDYYIQLTADTFARLICDRCGGEFDKNIQGKISVLYTFDRAKIRGKRDDDVKFIPPSSQEIDLTQDFIDALVLAIPIKILCREECKGLCDVCGTNLNIKKCSCKRDAQDPRWNVLKNIKFVD